MDLATAKHLGRKVISRSMRETLYFQTGYNLTKPTDIRATLTERCNYRCAYCNHWRQDFYTDEMTLPEWQSALISIREFVGRYAVQFLGGEPMLVPWFPQLVTFCGQQGIDWGVITNGSTLTAKMVTAIVAANPLNIDVSLDSIVVAENDVTRGVRGATRRVSDGILRLVAERERAGRHFTIRIKPTVSQMTIGSLSRVVDWAETMPSVLVDFSPVRLASQADRLAMYPHRSEDIETLRSEIELLVSRKNDGAPIETSVAKLRAIIPHFLGHTSRHGVDRCRVGLRSIDIRPNGDVNHCFKFSRVGNLRDSPIEEIWASASRHEVVKETVSCNLIGTVCSMSCFGHRTLAQEVKRGIRLIKSGR